MDKYLDFNKISIHQRPEHSPGFLLWHISTSWRSSIEAVLKPMDLTHPQFVVLATIGWLTRTGEKVTQRSISKMAGLDPNTTSQILKGLEKKDLLKREPSSDGRAKNPLLTSKGGEILASALPAVESADARFFDNLTANQIKCMIGLFQMLC